QKRRWQRMLDEVGAMPRVPDDLLTLVKAFGAASEIEYRQSKRRLYDVLDLLTTRALPKEGVTMTDGERFKLLSRIQYHQKWAAEVVNDDPEHAAMHETIAAQLRGYLKHRPAPSEMPEPAKRPIRRSYL